MTYADLHQTNHMTYKEATISNICTLHYKRYGEIPSVTELIEYSEDELDDIFEKLANDQNIDSVEEPPASLEIETAQESSRPPLSTDGDGYPFVIITENVAFSPELSDRGLRVFMGLKHFGRDKNSCFPKVETLAQLVGKGITQVREILRELETLGLIKTEFHDGRPSLYRLTHYPLMKHVPTENRRARNGNPVGRRRKSGAGNRLKKLHKELSANGIPLRGGDEGAPPLSGDIYSCRVREARSALNRD